MPRAAAALRILGWALLGAVALAGVAVSALMAVASAPGGRELVAAKLIRFADDRVAGRLELGGLTLLPGGRVAIRDFRAFDPDGRLVLQVDRVLVSVDATRLRSRSIGVDVELDGAAVLIDEDDEGRLSLARAFAPAHPSPPSAEPSSPTPWRDPIAGWTVRLRRLTVANASLWWQDAAGRTRVEVQDVEVAARGLVGPGRARAEVNLRANALSPVPGPTALDLRATLDGDQLLVPLLRAQLGGTSLSGLAQGDLRTRVGRAALTRATVDRAQARALVKGAPAGADLALDAYADADGRIATAAIHLAPASARTGRAGGGDAAVALRLDGARALGFDVLTEALDPSALLAAAPAGRVSLAAHGGLAGQDYGSAAGNLELSLARSTLRGGELGPAAVSASLDRGSWTARRVALAAPGLQVQGQGAWRKGGAATGHFTADVGDLARAADNAGRLLATSLPRLAGRGRMEADLSGTAAAPVVAARIAAPALAVGGVTASGVDGRIEARGPFRPGALRLDAAVRRLSSGAEVLAQGMTLQGELRPEGGETAVVVSASGQVPSLGREPVSLEAAGTLPPDRAALLLARLTLAYPGTRYALEAPARIAFAGPRVDRLALVAGPRRIAVSGGVGPRRTLDARLEVERLDLARLPVGVLPADLGIAGELTADAAATGTLARPVVEGRVAVAGGAFRGERQLDLRGKARWDGGARRLAAQLAVKRAGGGAADLEAELPVPLRGRGNEPVSATLRTEALPLATVLGLAGVDADPAPVRGLLDASVHLGGTAAAPQLRVQAGVAQGEVRDLAGIGAQATVELGASATATADVQLSGKPAVKLEAAAPLSLAAVLADPARTLERLQAAKVTARAAFPGLDLAALSGRLGVPAGLRGRLSGEVKLASRPDAPRGTARLVVDDAAWDGYAGIRAQLDAEARDERVEARLAGSVSGEALLQLTASLGAPVERLATRAGLRTAALRVDGAVPLVELDKAAASSGVSVAVGGLVQAKLHAEGTLERPAVTLDASGRSVRIAGRPVGEVELTARAGGQQASANVTLTPPAGGRLVGAAALTAPISLELRGAALRAAPTEVRVRADGLDLGFLPALLPGTVRSAAGRLDADVTASGPLADLAPRGAVRLAGGRLGLLDYGDWSGIGLEGEITAQALELRSFEARRGNGRLTARAALRGLDTPRAALDGRVDVDKLTITRAGTDLGTLTFGMKMSGGYAAHRLDVRLDLPSALVRLADKLPRDLQSLEQRPDIVVGPKPTKKPVEVGAAPDGSPFVLAVRVVSPGRLDVQRNTPRIRLELKADVTYERQGGGDYMSGTVEVVRGTVEPLSDRRFDVKRGRMTFTGGPPAAALLDVEAVYDNPAAVVTVDVTGPLSKPNISLKSQPPLDDGQIAMLIATGQTELKAGGGGAAGAGQSELSGGAAQRLGFAVFNTFIRNQLPFSTGDVSLDASSARVSGYVPGTPIYIGFLRRFDANKQLGENQSEVRVEYAITPHWSLEGRFGDQSTGGASLIWSKDY